MSAEKRSSRADVPLTEEELFVLEAGRRMSLHNRLLWLEEMHELVLRWSKNRPMMYPDGTVIGPKVGLVAEAPGSLPATPVDGSSAERL